MLDLDAAFERLRAREDREAKEAHERKVRTQEAIRLAGDECQRSFGGLGKVEVRREAKGVALDAGSHGWMTVLFREPTEYTVRTGKKRMDVVPPDANILEWELKGESALGDAIAQWYAGLPIPT